MKPNRVFTECLSLNSYRRYRTGKRLMSDFLDFSKVRMTHAHLWIAISVLTFTCLFVPSIGSADETGSQQVFSSPNAAVNALFAAAKSDDMKALSSILGPEADQVLSSGDPVADNNARDNFVRHYQEMHRLAYDREGRVVLFIGADNWPLPIPLVKNNGGWIFDTTAGKEELLYRRVGRNELFTITVLEDLADAQDEYASEAREGEGTAQFAQRIMSTTGKQDGLYWETTEGQPESPIGPLVASATAEGYQKGKSGSPIPFHGYYYRVLTKQGPNAPGGARNYLVNGKMTKGFAFLAYPAEYRASGVMTFMINQDGIIVEKDLGPETTDLAREMSEYNPDKSWQEVDD